MFHARSIYKLLNKFCAFFQDYMPLLSDVKLWVFYNLTTTTSGIILHFKTPLFWPFYVSMAVNSWCWWGREPNSPVSVLINLLCLQYLLIIQIASNKRLNTELWQLETRTEGNIIIMRKLWTQSLFKKNCPIKCTANGATAPINWINDSKLIN